MPRRAGGSREYDDAVAWPPTKGPRKGTGPTTSLARLLADCRADAVTTACALVDRQDAEDVVQEATLRVLGAVARGAVVEEPRAYLRAVVRHVAADHLRATRGHASLGNVSEHASPHANPQQAIELREVLEAIEELPPGQRRALLGTVLTTHDQRRLAHVLQTTPAGVRQLVRRARQRLHNRLGAWIPWLSTRVVELMGSFAPGSGMRSGAVAVAVAAVIAPSVPSPPTPPTPASAPNPLPVVQPSAPVGASSSHRTTTIAPLSAATRAARSVERVTPPTAPPRPSAPASPPPPN
jgi:RNA polymerase sigma factor (sigma-70 family)